MWVKRERGVVTAMSERRPDDQPVEDLLRSVVVEIECLRECLTELAKQSTKPRAAELAQVDSSLELALYWLQDRGDTKETALADGH